MNKPLFWLQIHLVCVVILSTLLLGSGLNDPRMPIIGASAALLSFLFTERLGWIRLNRFVANLLAVGIAVFSIYRFFGDSLSGDVKLGSIANLLTYVQVVLLFQAKSARLYWNIWVLSLLQVVVAAALSLHFEVGFLFFAFFVLSLSTMALITMVVDGEQLRESQSLALATRTNNTRSTAGQAMSLNEIFQQLTLHRPVTDQPGHSQNYLIGQMFSMSLIAGITALVFATTLFCSVPRHDDVWYGPNFAKSSTVGFSQQVSFDHADTIQQTNKSVMRVQFIDRSGKPLKLGTAPFFRGITLGRFERPVDESHHHGQTQFLPMIPPLGNQQKYRLERTPFKEIPESEKLIYVRESVVMQPSTDPIVFSCVPVYRMVKDQFGTADSALLNHPQLMNNVEIDFLTETLVCSRSARELFETRPLRCELSVPLYYGDRMLPAYPSSPPSRYYRTYLEKPDREIYSTLYEAVDYVRETTPPDNRKMFAFRLSEYFQASEEFSYALDYRDVEFDRSLDPIEDFMRNHKTGHCEYYAAALALMLRAADIPSRVVVGYRGGDFNAVGSFYEVKQRHAHAWVEAYLRPQDCSLDMFETGQADVRTGAWFRLDPTPTDAQVIDLQGRDLLDRAGDAISYAQSIWDDYILGMDSTRQEENLLQPNGGVLFGDAMRIENWREQYGILRTSFGKWTGTLLIALLSGVGLLLVYRLLKRRSAKDSNKRKSILARVVERLSPRLANWMFDDQTAPPTLAWHTSLLSILKKHHYKTFPHQTLSEVAASVLENSNSPGGTEPTALAQQLQRIVELYYQVRFGGATLDEAREQRFQKELQALDLMLDGARQ
jgi:hypothetical protein